MRYTNLLPFAAALATAIVIPDESTAQQMSLEVQQSSEKADEVAPAWWDSLRSAPEAALDFVGRKANSLLDKVDSLFESDEDGEAIFGLPSHHPNYTAYGALITSNYTKKFAALVNEFPDIVDLLNSTESNVTLFIPLDRAFEKIPEHHWQPPKEYRKKIVEYHILRETYPAGRMLASHTLPTDLNSEALGERPQRLRVGLSLFGLKLNFFSKVVVADAFMKNGVVHGLNDILIPPPPAGRLISLFPSKFSTLELAATKTGLIPHHDKDDVDHAHHSLTGLTLFAPTNEAFARLGPVANAFLFNTEKGLGYLRALLKYHIVLNETLYSDAYYGVKGRSEDLFTPSSGDEIEGEMDDKNGHFHIDMPTLLEGKSLSIDIARWYGIITMKINGRTRVAFEDGCARDGVVQVVSSVLFPPRPVKESEGPAWIPERGEISVEELVEILQPYVDADDQGQKTENSADQVWAEL